MLRITSIAALVLAVSAGTAAAQPLLSLEDAVRMVLDSNYGVRQAQNEAQIAANDYALGNAGFLPTVNVSAQQSRRTFGSFAGSGPSFGGSSQSVDVAMNLQATLFDGMGRFAAYERLESAKEQAALGAVVTTESALADVVVAYYDLVRRQEQLEVLEEAVTLSEERLRIASLRRDLGSASELEVRRAQVDLNADRAALLREQVALASAKTFFNQLVARDGGLDFRVADTIRVERQLDPERLASRAGDRNPSLLLARQTRQTALLSRKEVRSDWLPTLGLQVGYAFNDFTSDIGLPSSRPGGFSYGLTASWGLFEGFNRDRRLENASLRLRNAEIAIAEANTRLVTGLENAFETYRGALTLVDLERENIALARFNVEVALEQFRLGTITSVELREVQSALTGTEARYINAQFEAKRAETELLQLSGTLRERLVETL